MTLTIVELLVILMAVIGTAFGYGINSGLRILRNLGSWWIVQVDLASRTGNVALRRVQGGKLVVTRGTTEYEVPLKAGDVFADRMTGRRIAVLDGELGLPLKIDESKKALAHPDGSILRQIGQSTMHRKFNEETDNMGVWKFVAVVGLLGLLIIGGVVVWIAMNVHTGK